MKIDPKCLKSFPDEYQGAAYTSDGFMLPCCWMDDPNEEEFVIKQNLKDNTLKVSNNESLENIFTSDQWENFFRILIYNPENASNTCKTKCGIRGKL